MCKGGDSKERVPTSGFFGKSVIVNAGLLGTQVRGVLLKSTQERLFS